MINYDVLCFGLAAVIACLFIMAALGMSGGPRRSSHRPRKWRK